MDSLTSYATTTTRPAAANDDPLLFELYKTTRAWEMTQVNWSEEEKNRFLQQQFNAQKTHYTQTFPNAQHEIIVQNGRSIGRIYVNHTPTEIRLLDIVLLPEARNQGIGSTLIDQLKNQAQQANIPLRFYVWQLNHAAQRFYQRQGCQPVTAIGAYILMEWQPQ